MNKDGKKYLNTLQQTNNANKICIKMSHTML